MSLTLDRYNLGKLELLKLINCINVHQLPNIYKVTISNGFGSVLNNNDLIKLIIKDITLISSQKPILTKSKNSIAGFKIKKGMNIGLKVTLRKIRMYEFLDKLIHIVLPRIRDFKGFNQKNIDKMGNFSFGIKEYSIFPEVKYNKSTQLFGLNINICVAFSNIQKTLKLLSYLNFPFIENID